MRVSESWLGLRVSGFGFALWSVRWFASDEMAASENREN